MIIQINLVNALVHEQKEVTLNKRRNKLDMEKIFATVFSLALLVALIVGITSILKDNNSESDGKKNYVDLNELAMETSSDELVNMAGSETQNNTNENVDIANNKTDIKDDKKNEKQLHQIQQGCREIHDR